MLPNGGGTEGWYKVVAASWGLTPLLPTRLYAPLANMTKHDNEKDFQTTDTQQTLAEPSLLSGPAHTLDVGRVCKELEVDITAGLSAAECAKRHAEHGDNILNPPPKPNVRDDS